MADRRYSVVLFGEDVGHRAVVGALVKRVGADLGVLAEPDVRSATGGYGTAVAEYRNYLDRVAQSYEEPLPDAIVVAVDANEAGLNARTGEIEDLAGEYAFAVVAAVPDPYVERWLIECLGVRTTKPRRKAQRGIFKRILIEELVKAGKQPITGFEDADDIVGRCDLDSVRERSLARFVTDLRAALSRWSEG